jgi:hypothetical protein
MEDNTSLLNQAHVQYQSGTRGSTVETQHLASLLGRAPNYGSGGYEFESPMRRELAALTTSGKTLGARSFYNTHKFPWASSNLK